MADNPLAAISIDDFRRIPLHLAASRRNTGRHDARMFCLVMRNRAGLPPLLCARRALAVNYARAARCRQWRNAETLLHIAAASGEAWPELLVARSQLAQLSTRATQNGKLPLHIAAAAGRVDAACMLLDHAAADGLQLLESTQRACVAVDRSLDLSGRRSAQTRS